jgi:hypothetical protein
LLIFVNLKTNLINRTQGPTVGRFKAQEFMKDEDFYMQVIQYLKEGNLYSKHRIDRQ